MKLPLDCEGAYHRQFLAESESRDLFQWILDNHAQDLNDGVRLADGTLHGTGVGKLMFVDKELTDGHLLHESFGNRREWPPIVARVRDRVEALTDTEFGVCVCLYYVNGSAGVDFHTDLPAYGDVSVIPSISLGQERELIFRRRTDPYDELSLALENGSLLVMGPGCQAAYEHALPVNRAYEQPRINLTFRTFGWPQGARQRRRKR